MAKRNRFSVLLALLFNWSPLPGAENAALKREEVIASMRPYDGPSKTGVDGSTLVGKVLCGDDGLPRPATARTEDGGRPVPGVFSVLRLISYFLMKDISG